MMRHVVHKWSLFVVIAVALAIGGPLAGFQEGAAPPPGEQPAPAPESAVSAVGLLPIYGITLEFDKSWVDGKKFPSAALNVGVSEAFQQLWDNHLKACGFNVLRFPVDVRDPKSEESTRLANLCLWAKQHNVKLAPGLIGSESGQPLPKDYATKASSFVRSLLSLLKRNKGKDLDAYGQIAFYQLEQPLNHPAVHGQMEAAAAADLLKKTANNIRKAEESALKGTQLQPTQLMVSASFDYELLKGVAIAGTEMSEDAYQQAYENLKGFLAALADAPEIGMFAVEWFPGSVSAEAVDRLPDAHSAPR